MRRWLVPIVLLLATAPAARADTPATCGDLQAKLGAASPGATIVLSGTCSHQSFTLPSTASGHGPITLRAAAPGDGFDGGAANTPILTGHDIGATTISGLTFRHGAITSGAGAAIRIDGASAPRIAGSKFLSNSGGAIFIVSNLTDGTTTISGNTIGSPGNGNTGPAGAGLNLSVQTGGAALTGNDISGNTATSGRGGGALLTTTAGTWLTVSNNRFTANSLSAATGDQDGGGMSVNDLGGSGPVTISQNQFIENTIGASAGKRHGAGLAIIGIGDAQTRVTQIGNGFDQNSIAAAATGEAGGAGEWIAGARVDSTGDSFTSNTVSHPGGEGAGVGVEGVVHSPGFFAGELHATDLVADGNRLAVGGRGAGVYAGGPDTCTGTPDCPSVLDLLNATIAGNCIAPGAGSQAPGIAGSGDDTLNVRNSIVYDHQAALPCASPAPLVDVAGFGTTAIASSDVCDGLSGSGAPVAGPANICADPLLENPHLGGFRETALSPTIDRGANAFVPTVLGLDAEGGARITDGNGDGTATVDMGADESAERGPTDKTAPKITILSRRIKESATARVHIRLKCVEETHCGGRLTLSTAVGGKKLAAGSGRFNIPGGRRRTVVIRLPRKVRTRLDRRRTIRITAKATATDLAGNVGHATKRVTVKARSRKRKK